jgi:uncharacterized membrane protein
MARRGTLSGLGWCPFVILAGAGVAIWSSGPGKPAAVVPAGVRLLILVVGLVLAVFLEVMARMLETRQRLAAGYDTSPETARTILDVTAGITRVLNIAVAVFMVILAVPLAGLGPGLAVGLGTAIILGAMGWAVWSLKSVHLELEQAGQLQGLEGWNGIIYNNPKDARLWVPKISGYGTTLNFAHRRAWVMLGSILLLSLGAAIVGVVSSFCCR